MYFHAFDIFTLIQIAIISSYNHNIHAPLHKGLGQIVRTECSSA